MIESSSLLTQPQGLSPSRALRCSAAFGQDTVLSFRLRRRLMKGRDRGFDNRRLFVCQITGASEEMQIYLLGTDFRNQYVGICLKTSTIDSNVKT